MRRSYRQSTLTKISGLVFLGATIFATVISNVRFTPNSLHGFTSVTRMLWKRFPCCWSQQFSTSFLSLCKNHDRKWLRTPTVWILLIWVVSWWFLFRILVPYGARIPQVAILDSATTERSSASKLSFYGTECGSKMTIVTVACGDRVEQSITLFQSMLLLAGCDLSFIVYTEEDDLEALRKKLNSLANAKHFRHPAINLMVKPAVYPNSTAPDGTVWKGIYMPCSTLRLFLPAILPEIDVVIYLDSDTLTVSPIDELWSQFEKMKDTVQMAAFIPEHEHPAVGWYNVHARVPFVAPLGVNSGVILMNLTRMREHNWTRMVDAAYLQYKDKLVLHDQDIFNIIFHDKPANVLILPCIWNFRTHQKHCNNTAGYHCRDAFEPGGAPKILHGTSSTFHVPPERQEYTSLYYRAFQKFSGVTDDAQIGLWSPLEMAIQNRQSQQPFCQPLDVDLVRKMKELSSREPTKLTQLE